MRQDAQLEPSATNGHEPDNRFVAFRNHDFLAGEGGFDQMRKLRLCCVNCSCRMEILALAKFARCGSSPVKAAVQAHSFSDAKRANFLA